METYLMALTQCPFKNSIILTTECKPSLRIPNQAVSVNMHMQKWCLLTNRKVLWVTSLVRVLSAYRHWVSGKKFACETVYCLMSSEYLWNVQRELTDWMPQMVWTCTLESQN